MREERAEVVIVGSGAGGAVTALELAQAGHDVLVIEEGRRHDLSDYGKSFPVAMERLYRRRGMTPIVGQVPIGYVEGACFGGSTEINSGFWHRTPREILLRWKAQFDLTDCSEEDLRPHFEWAEATLGVRLSEKPWPKGTEVFARGVGKMGWSYQEVPRAAPGCRQTNACAQGCPTGAKQGMSRRILPEAEAAGARVLTRTRVARLRTSGPRVTQLEAFHTAESGEVESLRVSADHVFVCAGPTETPALLQKSGIRENVGRTLRIHPYLKVVARFKERIDAQSSVLPLLQVKEFWPDLSLGGGFSTPEQFAMTLSENWPQNKHHVQSFEHMAQYYVGVRGTGLGRVRPSWASSQDTEVRYELSDEDLRNLSVGLARLSAVLLAAGAEEVYPAVWGVPSIRTEMEAIRWLDQLLPKDGLSLVTVHAFSACPIGERRHRCAANSYGKVYGYENLFLSDASVLPDSPGVNPQGSVMALARRNARHFTSTVSS